MRPLLLLLAISSLASLVAQKDGANPTAIEYIYKACLELNDSTMGLEITLLDDGTEIGKQGDNIRRIVTSGTADETLSYYYTALGNPLLLLSQSPKNEERFYFDPQLDDGPGRLRMIRWIENKKHHKPIEKVFDETGKRVLKDAFDLLHRVQGELEFTAEVYSAIRKRLARIDKTLAEREYVAIDTIDRLAPEDAAITVSDEQDQSCWDTMVRFSGTDDSSVLRTIESSGCDGGGTTNATIVLTTDFGKQKNRLRTTSVSNEVLPEASDGKGQVNHGFSATTTTYFDDGKPVYELLTSEQQGFEVFRRLTLLDE